jgi:two-component system sensor histidine kinase/response regulator
MAYGCRIIPDNKEPMTNNEFVESEDRTLTFRLEVKKRSDRLMNYFLTGFFLVGLVLAFFYDTWLIAFGVGGLLLLAYYSVKIALPDSSLYQYVLSAVLGVFMAQFIYQMHGLFEMHFFAFIASALLITYQKWRLQIPVTVVVVIHHASLGYLQDIGFTKVYFSQLDYFTLQTFIIHVLLAAVVFFICGLWAYQLKKYNEINILQTIQMSDLQKEVQLSIERKKSAEILEMQNEKLREISWMQSHVIRAPLAKIKALIPLINDVKENSVEREKMLDYLLLSANELDEVIGNITDKTNVIDL